MMKQEQVYTKDQQQAMERAGVAHMATAPLVPASVPADDQEEDFLNGKVAACTLGEACESCQ